MPVLPSSKNMSTARILHDVCPKNTFSSEFRQRATAPRPPISYAYEQEIVSDSGLTWAICKIYTLTKICNHASIPLLSLLHARYPSCCQANSVKALKAEKQKTDLQIVFYHVHVYFGPLITKNRTIASTDPMRSHFICHVLYIIVKLGVMKLASYT